MQIGDICSREVYVVKRDEPLAEAAREMLKRHVGALVVVEPPGTPIGILTDRDVVCGQMERKADLHCLSVGDVMTSHPLTIEEGCGIEEAVRHLSARGVRRAPVVTKSCDLIGIVSLIRKTP